MALFETSELKELQPELRSAEAIGDSSEQHFLLLKNRAAVERIIAVMKESETVHFVTGGMFSSHDLLFTLLQQLGPSKVYITTWTMTEYPARLLSEALISGKITELFCILDVRMEKNDNVFQLIRNNCTKIRLSNCHAKVMVVDNGKEAVCVISSQNMTENPRIEAGVICRNPDIAAFHREWILKEIEHGHAIE